MTKLHCIELLQRLKLISFLLTLLFLASCASYQSKIQDARSLLSSGSPTQAADQLQEKASLTGRDQVVFLLDYGMARHLSGEYIESNLALLKAERLAEVKDYTSLSRESGAILANERLVQYKSDRYENLLINSYVALNYLMLRDYDEALVECRKIDIKMNKYRLEGEPEAKNFFARYLSAMVWQAQRNWDSAYIDYKNAYDVNPSHQDLPKYLMLMAWKAGRKKDLRRWRDNWPHFDFKKAVEDFKKGGELVLLYQQGWAPRKRQRPRDRRFPMLREVRSHYNKAQLVVSQSQVVPTRTIYNIAEDAFRTFKSYYKTLVARKLVGEAARLVLARSIDSKKEKGWGEIARLALQLTDQADLRQWSTLPESLQVARISLPPGEHDVRVEAISTSRNKQLWKGSVKVLKGKTYFLTERTY